MHKYAKNQIVILGSIGLTLISGCSEEWGPESMPTTTVIGTLHQSGVPMTQGWLEFMPVDGTVGRSTSAAIDQQGRFRSLQVPVGSVAIRLVGTNLNDPELAMLSQVYLIRRRIPEQGTENLEIDLDVVRIQRRLQPGL